jgi:hypothetical protein
MDLLKLEKARNFLMKSEKAEKAFIDVLTQRKLPEELKNKLIFIQELVIFCERDEVEINLVDAVISSLLRNKNPATKDVMKFLEILNECQNELKRFIIEKTHLYAPKTKKFIEYYTAILKYIEMKGKSKKEERKELVREQIFQRPGLYIAFLAEIMQNEFGEEGFSISNIRHYVNELSFEKKIITVGGPQGRYRYCFPNLNLIQDRTEFYHTISALEGIVEEKITDKFIQKGRGKFRDIFYVNGTSNPFLLLVDFGKLFNIERKLIISYGEFEPFNYLTETENIAPKDHALNVDVLRARKVAQVVDGREEEVWADTRKANIFA